MATATFELEATDRSDLGKGASRRLRRLQDLVPGIIYGGSEKPKSISLEQRILRKALENEAFYSHILTLKVNGKAEKVVVKDIQRHAFRPLIQHMDFQRVDMNRPLHMHVPLHFINEAIAPGVKDAGGQVSHQLSDVEILCLPSDLPEFIEVDLSKCELNDIIHLSNLVLPKGVTLVALNHENDMSVASIHMPKVIVEEEITEEAAEGEEKAKSEEEAKEGKSEEKAESKSDKK